MDLEVKNLLRINISKEFIPDEEYLKNIEGMQESIVKVSNEQS